MDLIVFRVDLFQEYSPPVLEIGPVSYLPCSFQQAGPYGYNDSGLQDETNLTVFRYT